MVNVGTGNMLLQDDDMTVPHKGIALAFRRTYNSQNRPTFAGDLNAYTTMYGNGWTNTFDAHLVRTSPTQYTVFDVDGARYDYVVSNGHSVESLPGDHSHLDTDLGCGMTWTKKSGTIYYFYNVDPSQTGCPQLGTMGGYAGRLYQIIGRNRNTSITFAYSWDNADASVNGKVSTITATTESGLSATLTFADVNGRRLLQTLTFPDGTTTVQYGYDSLGNLTTVSRPPNNASGTRPLQVFQYGTLGSDSVMTAAASPRWDAVGDGAYLAFAYAGSSAVTATLTTIAHVGVMDFTPPDGTNTVLQPGYSTSPVYYRTDYYTTGVTTPTYRDSDGHATNWVVDGSGRPTQTQECTVTTSQAQCIDTQHWLTTNESWDWNNNLISQTDARGYETDYAYDANGNTIAVAEPLQTTSEGTFRPTRLYDYDPQNNVVASCNESETNRGGANWTAAPTPSDSLCSSLNIPHATFTFSYPSYEPNGELTTITTPLGYKHRIGYELTKQGGTDYGLPTSVTSDSITQLDGTALTPSQSYWYDAHGSLRCYSKGVGTWVLSYDTDNRMTAVADPDDSSMNAGSLCAKSSGQSGWNTQTTTTYYPDGSKASVQSPSERAFGVSTSYTYNLDGDVITETAHHGCVPNQTCPDGTTTKWYDGADRLVEVGLPHDPRSFSFLAMPYDHPASFTRYLYDLSQGGTVNVGTSGPIRAYGNLYETLVTAGDGPGGWLEKAGSQFDALDRELAKYSWLIPGPGTNVDFTSTLETTQLLYDQDSTTLGLLAKKTNPAGESVTYMYNAANKVSSETYGNDGSRTANETYTYDAVGRAASIMSSQFGTQSYTYDDDGRLSTSVEPNQGGLTAPAQIQYSYYGNGQRSAVSFSTSTLNYQNALTYSYRSDGMLQTQSINAFAAGSWNRQYTDGGRPLTTGGVDMRSRTYDSNGQLLSDTMRGNAITFTRDPEGSMLTESFPSFTSVATMNYTYNVRGELIDSNSGSAGWGDERLEWVGTCGTHVSIPPNAETDPNANNPPTMDARSCAPIASGEIDQVTYNGGLYPSGSTNKVSYDAAGRAVHSVTYSAAFASPDETALVPESQNTDGSPAAAATPFPDAGDASNSVSGGGEIGSIQRSWGSGVVHSTTPRELTTTKTVDTLYDAENHTVSRGAAFVHTSTPVSQNGTATPAPTATPTTTTVSPVLGWGPNGHPAIAYPGTSAAMTLHWDGAAILFITDVNGNLVDFKAGLDGEVAPGDTTWTGLAVFDRDQGGMVIDTATPTRNLFDPLDTDGSPSVNAAWMVPQYAPYYRTDGFYIGDIQINGVRAFDPTVGAWTTPDAYEGDIHDPMSQQKYVFNGNNAIDYSDPSGYCTTSSATTADGKTLQGIGCVDAKPVPPSAQLMSDGRTVAEHIHDQQVFIGGISEAMTWVMPGGAEAKGLEGSVEVAAHAGPAARLASERITYLYQKVSATGEHLKYGITMDLRGRYSAAELAGGRLRVLASGSRADMLALERNLHTYLPIGPEENQGIYHSIQAALGYRLPPY